MYSYSGKIDEIKISKINVENIFGWELPVFVDKIKVDSFHIKCALLPLFSRLGQETDPISLIAVISPGLRVSSFNINT